MPSEYHCEVFSVGQVTLVKSSVRCGGIRTHVWVCQGIPILGKYLKIRVSRTYLNHLILKIFHETTGRCYTFSTFPTTKNMNVFLIMIFSYHFLTSFHLWEN